MSNLQPSEPNNRLFVGCFIEGVAINQPFLRSDWPLHITLMPWFLCGRVGELDAKIAKLTSSTGSFDVQVGGEAMFGSKRNIKVNIIKPSTRLTKLHNLLLASVKTLGRIDVDEQFTAEGYRAHVTHSNGRHKNRGDRIRINSIHLTELTDESRCTPLKRYDLKP